MLLTHFCSPIEYLMQHLKENVSGCNFICISCIIAGGYVTVLEIPVPYLSCLYCFIQYENRSILWFQLTSYLLWQVLPVWWFHRVIYLWLLLILLLCTLRYVRFHANIIFLRLYGLHLLWVLSHAWNRRFSRCTLLCSPYISINQMRVDNVANSMLAPVFFWFRRFSRTTMFFVF